MHLAVFFVVVVVKIIKQIPRKKLEKVTGITYNNFSPSFGPVSRKSVVTGSIVITGALKII